MKYDLITLLKIYLEKHNMSLEEALLILGLKRSDERSD